MKVSTYNLQISEWYNMDMVSPNTGPVKFNPILNTKNYLSKLCFNIIASSLSHFQSGHFNHWSLYAVVWSVKVMCHVHRNFIVSSALVTSGVHINYNIYYYAWIISSIPPYIGVACNPTVFHKLPSPQKLHFMHLILPTQIFHSMGYKKMILFWQVRSCHYIAFLVGYHYYHYINTFT